MRYSWSIFLGQVVLACGIAVTLFSNAAEPHTAQPTFHASLKAASAAAAADPSLVLLILGAEWCAPCKALKKETLASAEFLEHSGALQIAEVDIDADAKTARGFGVKAVPTLVLLTADGKIVARHEGYLDAAGLLKWIEEGQARRKAGQWEGTVPTTKLDELANKSAGEGLDTNDLKRLVALLSQPDPADRAGVAKLILAQREQAVAPLIEAVSDPYLGTRIATSELLHKLAPQAVAVDAWQSPDELRDTVAALKKWWTDSGKLPPPGETGPVDPTVAGSIKAALDALSGDDPVPRTEAMSTLVGHGTASLPAVRDAIKRTERTGNQRVVTLLEDVRWAILIPDPLERRAGVRAALARAASQERQAATTRLGHAGRAAITPLVELTSDADPLVVENAVRALSEIGGQDTIPAMAALLKAADSNLRMTAAQALGHTKNAEATKSLLTVLDDPNEVVACTAIAAVEEVNASEQYSSSRKAAPPEVAATLKRALADPRWRVRAAAAEVAGKLSLTELAEPLKKLLDDADGFVVKNALVALRGLSAAPGARQLADLSQRLPSLRGDAVEMMAQSESEETVKLVTAMYDAGGTEARLSILGALARQESNDEKKTDDVWKPLVTKAATSAEPRLRRAAVRLLGTRAAPLVAEVISPLLADEDLETRTAAAGVLLRIIAGESVAMARIRRLGGVSYGSASPRLSKTNTWLTAERVTAWHGALQKHAEPAPDVIVATAIYATGDGKSDLPVLVSALETLKATNTESLLIVPVVPIVLARLPWPEGKPVLDRFCDSAWLFVSATMDTQRRAPAVTDYLMEPARFKAAVERAAPPEIEWSLQALLGNSQGWSLLAPTERTRAILSALLDSTNGAWRAAAVYALGLRPSVTNATVFEQALKDANPWVRVAAAQSLARQLQSRTELGRTLGPLLADSNPNVAQMAAQGLLSPQVRYAGNLVWQLESFRFESVQVSPAENNVIIEDRPLATLETKPAFLEQARRWLTTTNMETRSVFALLLAQYGEFDGVDRLLAQRQQHAADNERALDYPLLAGIALSRDVKYVPFLRQLIHTRSNEWELRRILQTLKGMTNADARQLRVEINKRMRTPNQFSVE